MSAICSHTASLELTELPEAIAGCQECLAIGGTWVHLRMCQTCGRIGCCELPAPACLGPRPHLAASDRPLRRAGRGLELVLPGQSRVRGHRAVTATRRVPSSVAR